MNYVTIFQAEVNINILSDSEAAIKALGKYQITSKLV
jgi:hypothetical protein